MNILLYNTLCVKAAMGKKEACLNKSNNTNGPFFFICTQCAEQFHPEQNINAKLILWYSFFLKQFQRLAFFISIKYHREFSITNNTKHCFWHLWQLASGKRITFKTIELKGGWTVNKLTIISLTKIFNQTFCL